MLAVVGLAAVRAAAQEVGPARGALVIVGGAMRDPAIVERFIELAGGPEAPIVVIPTAGGGEGYDQRYPGLRVFREAGAADLTVLHTRDRAVADDPAFSAPLRRAGGVWFPGGRQWRLADAYLGTRVQDEHLLRRNRQFDLVEVIEAHPHLLGIGIDEDTAIVVEGDRFEVMGRSYVAIYDHERLLDSGGRFYFLGAGDRYDLRRRQAYRIERVARPFDRVVERAWPAR